MLTSSDAKFRCLWHMFVWSIMLTLVSQFYIITDHVAFYIFGSLCILVLPFVTSLYSTTAGRRGASLLRVAYVLCDPVLACMAVVPVLLLNRLSPLIHEMECLGEEVKSWNETLKCLGNKSSSDLEILLKNEEVPFDRKPIFWLEKRGFLSGIQASIVMPCILAVLMGRRSRKMDYTTSLLAFSYWLVTALECITTIETTLLFGYSKVHFAVTTQVTVCVASILGNSYALVTLCSYLSPMTCKEDRPAAGARFDVIYKCVIGATGVAFVEIPQLVARFQMLASSSDWNNNKNNNNMHEKNSVSSNFIYSGAITNTSSMLNSSNISTTTISFLDQVHGAEVQTPPASSSLSFDPYDVYKTFPVSFYVWALKDVAMMIVIISLLVLQRFGAGQPILFKILGEGRNCAGAAFDNPNAFFVPEKRDKYIVTHCGKCQNQDFRDGAPKPTSTPQCSPGDRFIGQNSLEEEACFFLPKKSSKKSATAFISSIKPRWSPRKSHVNVMKDTNTFDYPGARGEPNDSKQKISLSSISNDGTNSSKTAYNLVDTATAITDNDTNSFLAATAAEPLRDPAMNCFSSNGQETSSAKDRRQRKTVKFSFSEDLSDGHKIESDRASNYSKQFGRSVSATGGIPSILVNSNTSHEKDDTLLTVKAMIGPLREGKVKPEIDEGRSS